LTRHLVCVGGEDHALRIPFLLGMRARGFRVTAVGSGDAAPFTKAGIDYHRYDLRRFIDPFADWRALRQLRRLFADTQPDIVQSFDTKPNLLAPFAASISGEWPVVRTINGMGWLFSSQSALAIALRPVYRGLHRRAARWTACTVFQNRDDEAYFQRNGMNGGRAFRLIGGSGVDLSTFQQARAAGPTPSQLRETLGLGTAEIVITVTRITRQKGIPVLLEAAALVHRRRPLVRFLLVGPRESEGPLAVTKDEIDRHAPYVLWLGERPDVPSLLGGARLFVLPTEYREGIPRVLLEAALASLPIVTTTMPGCTDVVQNGWNGVLVPPGRPELLAARILELLDDPARAQAMGARGADLVRREFLLTTTVDRYATLYEQVLAQARCLER
jgi:glycosyltransferase involved in cell wall biosynthesis